MAAPVVEKGAARRAAPRPPLAPVVAGAALVAAGGYLLGAALTVSDGSGPFLSGPRLAPLAVSGGWLAFALAYLTQEIRSYRSTRSRSAEPAPLSATEPASPPTTEPAPSSVVPATGAPSRSEVDSGPRAWVAPSLLVGALVAYILLLDVLGFVVASAGFVVGAARILGSRRLRRDLVVALALAPSLYLGFTRLLDIRLPEGVLPL